MRLLKYSVCKFCDKPIKYSGRGRPVIICDECKKELRDERRLYMLKYMRRYREKIRKLIYV